MTDIRSFAAEHRLRLTQGDDGEPVIPGRAGHIYEHGDSTLAVMVMPAGPRVWARQRRGLAAAGLEIWQDGDGEGAALFDPRDGAQARAAIRAVRARRRRVLTPGQRAAKAAILGRARAARAGPCP